jgi:RNA recognition motif-containing protein
MADVASTAATAFYVTGLTWWTQEVEVEAAFAELGPIDRVEPVDEPATGKFTGRSLVTFLSAEDAVNARKFLSSRG